MAINLTKGNGINLSKGLTKVRCEVSWDTEDDIDIHCFVLKNGLATRDEDFIFYNNKIYPNGAVVHSGDTRNGTKVTNGADETIKVNLGLLEPDKDEVLFSASINGAIENGTHFGKIPNVIIELINDETNEKIANYNATTDLFGEVCGKIAKVVKREGNWKFEAVGEGVSSLESLIEETGLTLQ